MNGKRIAKIAGAGAVGLVLGGPPAALVSAGVIWGVTDGDYTQTVASSASSVFKRNNTPKQ